MEIKIGKKVIGEGHPVFVVAEIASAHQGKVEICKELIKSASENGADAVKFQKFICDELIVPTDPRYETLKKIEMNEYEWRKIISYAKKFDCEIIADVFDERSADFMDGLGVAAFKIHSTDLTNPYLIAHVAKKKKPIFLATGGSTLEEIQAAVDIVKSHDNENIVLIHGFQGYPTRLEDAKLRFIQTLKKNFGLNVGYHDHTDAESELALVLPCAAIVLGAVSIEKHLILDRSSKGFDYYSALHPDEFKRMVEYIREVEKSLGSGQLEFSDAEKTYRETMKKNIVARVDIPPKTIISMDMLTFKRSEPGLPPSEASKIVGRSTKKLVKKNETITWKMLT